MYTRPGYRERTMPKNFLTLKILLLLGTIGLILLIALEAARTGFPPQVIAGPSVAFELATVHFEQNATDGDVEVVFKVTGGDTGLAKLTVVSPDGHTVIDFSAPAVSTLGIRQFVFESPEPGDVESLKAAYPEGVYTFTGATGDGDRLHGMARLNHFLPNTATILHPGPQAQEVATKNLAIAWTPVNNLKGYIIEIEQDEMSVRVEAQLPGSATVFDVPDGVLLPNTKYQVAIGTITEEGNTSFVETTFTTAKKG